MTNAVFSISSALISSARADMIAGIDARKNMEKTLKQGVAFDQIIATLTSHQARIAKVDSFSIAYLAQASMNVINENDDITGTALFSQFFTLQARSNACLNEKAIPRVLTLSRLLNGSTLDRSSADEEATACVIDALRQGLTTGSDIKRQMRLSMIAGKFGKSRIDWNAEGTQGSSSLRALLVMGLVSKSGTSWNISDKARFARLCDGIDGIAYEGATTYLNTLPTRPLLALPAPVVAAQSVPDAATVYRAVTATVDDVKRFSASQAVAIVPAAAVLTIETTAEVMSDVPAVTKKAKRATKAK